MDDIVEYYAQQCVTCKFNADDAEKRIAEFISDNTKTPADVNRAKSEYYRYLMMYWSYKAQYYEAVEKNKKWLERTEGRE